ncbi:MAG: desulfoferrodoxin [Bacillota bacterium]
MTELNQVYKCNICGNIVEVLHAGKGGLVCCNKPMELLQENTVDASREKHVPVVVKEGNKVTVKVGSAEHPMEEKHYIEWIEVLSGGMAYRQHLKPGERPEAIFNIGAGNIKARGYCNIHGLWSVED